MKHSSTLFLKVILLFVALAVIMGMIRFPLTEGRAVNLDLVSIYADPLIIYAYIASIPFFIGLFQAFKLLNYIDKENAFSKGAITTLKNIKFASLSLIGFIIVAVLYIRFFVHGDDPAGPTMLGLLVAFACATIATATTVFQKILENGVNIKSRKKA